MIADLVHQFALGALAEAQGNPRLLERDGHLFWRAIGGFLYALTFDRHGIITVSWTTP